ncbi:PR-1-like protein [Pholiota conissans]|uniref:PR-1-like protein n=1 Tax=Pholiota conissans TaxID=109636 RepID=A0A9P6CXV7_9AGAR|nr:PR-1-like protein [Pholiota conissans]
MFRLLLIVLAPAISALGLANPVALKRDAWSDQVVSLHNSYRAQYGASPVSWNQNLYASALSWAQQCNFVHSPGGKYGENLYAIGSTSADALTMGLKSWMSEASKYDYNNPGFTSSTGHFTQVVWKSTTGVACAQANCAAGTIFPNNASKFLVCRYTPPGNVAGQFPQNVGRHV